MNCEHVRTRIGDHLEGDLELAERARVDDHLAACPACRTELRELRATVALLRGLGDPEQPAGLPEKVIARIDAGEGRPAAWVRGIWRLAEPRVAAALAAGVAGLFVLANLETGIPRDQGVLFGTRSVLGTGDGPRLDLSDFPARASRPLPPSWTSAMRVRDREDRIRSVVAMVAIGPALSLRRSPQPPQPVRRPTFFGQADLPEAFEVRPASRAPTR